MASAPPIVMRDPAELVPYTKNHKQHGPQQIEALARHIAAFGFDQPIVVDANDVIIKGHKRRLAAMSLRLKRVPVWISSLDEYQAIAARIGDNHLVTQQFDDAMLRFDLGTLQSHGMDMGLTGMDTELIDAIMQDEQLEPPPDDSPKVKELAISFDGQKVPVTEEEVIELRNRLKRYETRRGSRSGFFADMMQRDTLP